MNRIAHELNEKLSSLDPARAQQLESDVREAIDRVAKPVQGIEPSGWPDGYFEQTAGALEGEEFERAPQGELPARDYW